MILLSGMTAELNAPSDELDGAVRSFLVLALVDLGRERESVAVNLTALSHYLPRYNRSLARYAQDLLAKASSQVASRGLQEPFHRADTQRAVPVCRSRMAAGLFKQSHSPARIACLPAP